MLCMRILFINENFVLELLCFLFKVMLNLKKKSWTFLNLYTLIAKLYPKEKLNVNFFCRKSFFYDKNFHKCTNIKLLTSQTLLHQNFPVYSDLTTTTLFKTSTTAKRKCVGKTVLKEC